MFEYLRNEFFREIWAYIETFDQDFSILIVSMVVSVDLVRLKGTSLEEHPSLIFDGRRVFENSGEDG